MTIWVYLYAIVIHNAYVIFLFVDVKHLTEDYRILIVGKTGTGKSSFARLLTNSAKFKSSSGPLSVTTSLVKEKTTIVGKRCHIVDTSGIFGTENSTKEEEENK